MLKTSPNCITLLLTDEVIFGLANIVVPLPLIIDEDTVLGRVARPGHGTFTRGEVGVGRHALLVVPGEHALVFIVGQSDPKLLACL